VGREQVAIEQLGDPLALQAKRRDGGADDVALAFGQHGIGSYKIYIIYIL